MIHNPITIVPVVRTTGTAIRQWLYEDGRGYTIATITESPEGGEHVIRVNRDERAGHDRYTFTTFKGHGRAAEITAAALIDQGYEL